MTSQVPVIFCPSSLEINECCYLGLILKLTLEVPCNKSSRPILRYRQTYRFSKEKETISFLLVQVNTFKLY